MGASRGFGFAIPLTTTASIMAMTLLEACTEPKEYVEYCPDTESGEEGPTSCSQLECVTAGELAVSLWYDPVPFTTDQDPPPGDVEVTQAEQLVTYLEQDDDSITIEWTTELELTPSDGDVITIVETGTSVVPADGEGHADVTLTVTGVAPDADLVVEYEASAEDVTGTGSVGGHPVFELTHDGIVWTEACSAP